MDILLYKINMKFDFKKVKETIFNKWVMFFLISSIILTIGAGSILFPISKIIKFRPPLKAAVVKNDFEKSGYVNQHPRILINKNGISKLKANIKTDPNMKKWYNDCYKRADKYAREKVNCSYVWNSKYKSWTLNKTSLTSTMKPFPRSIETLMPLLGLMYQLTGEKRFANKAWEYIDAIGKFPNWKPWHYLETAQLGYGFAIAYDMFFDYFSRRQKRFIERCLKTKVLDTSKNFLIYGEHWGAGGSNWNSCCYCGVVTTALALYEVYPNDSIRTIRYAAKNAVNPFNEMAPDGVYIEGATYWAFGMNYAVNMLAGMNNVLDTDYGLSDNKYLKLTGDYGIYSKAPNNVSFTFGDGWETCHSGPFMYWLGNKYNKPYYSWFQNSYGDKVAMNDYYKVFNLFYYNPAKCKKPDWSKFDLDRKFDSIQPFITMRSEFNNPNALYLAMKGGMYPAGHQDLDAGDFNLTAMGQRWTLDLGSGDYSIPGYWDTKKHGQRWKVYAKDAESHNVIIFNPDEYEGQNVESQAKFEEFYSGTNSYAILNNTSTYVDDVKWSKRGVAMLDRKQILLQDEFECKKPSKIHWGLTLGNGDFKISNNGKTATLKKGGKTMVLTLLNNDNSKFALRDLKPLPTSKKPEYKKYSGKRLFINMENVKSGKIKVLFTPLWDKNTKVIVNDYGSLKNWKNSIK